LGAGRAFRGRGALGWGPPVGRPPGGFPCGPPAPEVVASGVDVVSFSGEKLLGGPQAGIVVGKRTFVSRLKKNPWNRALRIDKFTIAALEATLTAYEAGTARDTVPTLRLLTEPPTTVAARARRVLRGRGAGAAQSLAARVEEGRAQVGGGALPTVELPTAGLALGATDAAARALDAVLRVGDPPVVGRLVEDRLFLDCRTVLPSQVGALVKALITAARPHEERAPMSAPGRRHVVVGTAGHIDHGKTSLVKALTGTDTDRLPEEKARGITIDLGFAFLEEPDGLTIEIVDVPGHERFVKNMLAGVGGIDLAMLVVAA